MYNIIFVIFHRNLKCFQNVIANLIEHSTYFLHMQIQINYFETNVTRMFEGVDFVLELEVMVRIMFGSRICTVLGLF